MSANDPKQTSLSTDRSVDRCGHGSVGAAPLLYGVCFNIMISSMVRSDLASAGAVIMHRIWNVRLGSEADAESPHRIEFAWCHLRSRGKSQADSAERCSMQTASRLKLAGARLGSRFRRDRNEPIQRDCSLLAKQKRPGNKPGQKLQSPYRPPPKSRARTTTGRHSANHPAGSIFWGRAKESRQHLLR